MSGMSSLTSPDAKRRQQRFRSSIIATALRCALVIVIAVLIRVDHAARETQSASSEAAAVSAELIKEWLPEAESLNGTPDAVMTVRNEAGDAIGGVLTTLPKAKSIIGYRGPSNVLLALNEESMVIGAQLLSSEDTPEHVDAVLRDDGFLSQFDGWQPGAPLPIGQVDVVTGATLTSLAIVEGITLSMGVSKPSLRFPDGFSQDDLNLVAASRLTWQPVNSFEATLIDSDGQIAGRVLRTGPLVDAISGYQGPSEALIRLNAEGLTERIALRRTYDNEPYSGYLNQEKYFWKVFQNKSLTTVSKLDLEAEQVEGVSGATMTSMAVAETIVAAANEAETRHASPVSVAPVRSMRVSVHDLGTLIVLLAGMTINLTSLRRKKWLRVSWNLILIGYFGLITGNLISLAVISGWAVQGAAWRLAPGLTAVVVVSFLMSAIAGRNIYCSHICAHGALQQLIRRRARRSDTARKIFRRLTWIPGGVLLLAVIGTWLKMNWNLAAWEPFNAYIWYVAGTTSLVVAAGSVVLAWYVPMGYCRYACGTGRLLDYVRRSAHATRFTSADCLAVALALVIGLRIVMTG